MGKDLFILDTRLPFNQAIKDAFTAKGYGVHIPTNFEELPDEILKEASGYTAICLMANRRITPKQVEILKSNGNKLILCASAGYDNVPIEAVKEAGIRVARVPAYSPGSIAEYAVGCLFALAKNIHKSHDMTRKTNFLIGGLQCILFEDKTVGIIGTGMIGRKCAEKISHLVKTVLCYDPYPCHEWIETIPNAEYVSFDEVLSNAHFITVHVPLLPDTKHLINRETIGKMRKNVVIVNTSRGGVVSTEALLEGLKSGHVFGAALDVFEGEREYMFKDMSHKGFDTNPILKEIISMPNVIVSGHVAFFTDESLRKITEKTLQNYEGFMGKCERDESAYVV